jgi:hypothetical protein
MFDLNRWSIGTLLVWLPRLPAIHLYTAGVPFRREGKPLRSTSTRHWHGRPQALPCLLP